MKTSAKKQLPRCSLCGAPLLTAIEKEFKLCTQCQAKSLTDTQKVLKKMPSEPNTVTFTTKVPVSLAEKMRKRMKRQGVSAATYLRKLILRDVA